VIWHDERDVQPIASAVVMSTAIQHNVPRPVRQNPPILAYKGNEVWLGVPLQMRKVAAVKRHVGILRRPALTPDRNPRARSISRSIPAQVCLVASELPQSQPATNPRSIPTHVGPDALVWAGERKLALLLVNNECTTYFKYSEFFFNSSGTGGNGGNSCEYPLNKLTVFSERLVPSWTAILCTWPSEYPSHNEAPA
jgi:hypothetical protein